MKVRRSDCVLLVIDVQDRIIATIAEHETTVANIKALIGAARVLDVPVIATQQQNLGEYVPELKDLLPNAPNFQKFSFSCCGDPAIMRKLGEMSKKTVIVCGIETHICVLQTVLDLLTHGYSVLLVRDGTSSHASIDRETAIERMRGAGAMVGTAEAVVYELTEKAGTDRFRKILEIVKEKRSTSST